MQKRTRKQKSAPYDNDLIRAEMTRNHQTVEVVATKAKVAPKTVVAIRAGKAEVQVDKLARVAGAVGLRMVLIPKDAPVAA